MNTSATGGYLAPIGDQPTQDQSLIVFCQAVICGITAIDGTLARPRWQQEPPNLPPVDTDWVALGVTQINADTFHFEQHDPSANNGDGEDLLVRTEEFDLACSFYGPNADAKATMLRDGLAIGQNRDQLYLAGIGLISVGPAVSVPALVKQKWLNRTDIRVSLRRQIKRSYPILHLLSASGTIVTVQLNVNINA